MKNNKCFWCGGKGYVLIHNQCPFCRGTGIYGKKELALRNKLTKLHTINKVEVKLQ